MKSEPIGTVAFCIGNALNPDRRNATVMCLDSTASMLAQYNQ